MSQALDDFANWEDQIPVQCSSRLRFTVYKEIV